MISWGIRMAISAMVPLIWGITTNHVLESIWITLTAEAICWIELKGSYGWRIRVMLGGAVLTVLFSIIGSVTGTNIWLSVLCMFVVGFLATLFKNLGDRGSGLSIGIYLMFIFCNAYPAASFPAVKARIILILLGACWAILVGIVASLFMPTEQPYRRYIGLVWRAISSLVATINKGWDDNNPRSNIRDIYLQEKEVRTALDNSFQLYSSMAHQVSKDDKILYQLTQLRKIASLVTINITEISDEINGLNIKTLDNPLRLRLSSLLSALQRTADRISVYIITLKPEEALLVTSRINRIKKLLLLVKEHIDDYSKEANAVKRMVHLMERSVKLMERSMEIISEMGQDIPVYRSYSLLKTVFVLHPKYLLKTLPVLFNFNTFTTRYALRTAIAAGIALFIYKWFHIDHGYWLPFSVMIVTQPYFGATFKKAIDRVVGTLLGGLAGSVFLRVPAGLHIKEIILFITFILMVYYLRKKYAAAAFVITLNLVLLFNLEAALHPMIIVTRALCTIGGAGLAVVAGYALLPTWDKKWLPNYLASAIDCNYTYFIATFFSPKQNINWTKYKRSAESKNSNLFNSFNRYTQEPGDKEKATAYYSLITHSVRITRELNNINLESENKGVEQTGVATAGQQKCINECLGWFNTNMHDVLSLNPYLKTKLVASNPSFYSPFTLSELQSMYLEKLIIELKTLHEDMVKIYSLTS